MRARAVLIVDVGWPVQRYHTIAVTQFSSQGLRLLVRRGVLETTLLIEQIINHHVADQVNPARLMTLPSQIIHA